MLLTASQEGKHSVVLDVHINIQSLFEEKELQTAWPLAGLNPLRVMTRIYIYTIDILIL
jgi:hypothetical protein